MLMYLFKAWYNAGFEISPGPDYETITMSDSEDDMRVHHEGNRAPGWRVAYVMVQFEMGYILNLLSCKFVTC